MCEANNNKETNRVLYTNNMNKTSHKSTETLTVVKKDMRKNVINSNTTKIRIHTVITERVNITT